ncbi:MAG TPA: hypothetical protein VJN18_02870 [Polyangiaceae bacterium]|nr:hypothetical protein [Polyangiaceae bacterium]
MHATWLDAQGKTLIRALAVASEPSIFWDGRDAAGIIARISLPKGSGSLRPASHSLNGPSGRALDDHFLTPLGRSRGDSWLCDLVPHTCMNPSQARALAREYVPRATKFNFPDVKLPPVPREFADAQRQEAILAELEESRAETIVLLGDEPIRHWLKRFDSRWGALSDFVKVDSDYGLPRETTIAGRGYNVLALVHPRQAAALGAHSQMWRARHENWRVRVQP